MPISSKRGSHRGMSLHIRGSLTAQILFEEKLRPSMDFMLCLALSAASDSCQSLGRLPTISHLQPKSRSKMSWTRIKSLFSKRPFSPKFTPSSFKHPARAEVPLLYIPRMMRQLILFPITSIPLVLLVCQIF